MSKVKKAGAVISATTVATIFPGSVVAQAPDIQQAAVAVEASIQSAMPQAGQGSSPTLGQLGGVQAGATSSDAGAGAGGDGGGSGGGSGGSGGGSGGGGSGGH